MDQREFTGLVEQYEKLVYTVCYQFVHDTQLAEDLAQETFLSAYLHWDDCPPGSYKPWLARIAANKAKDYLKSAYRRRVMPDDGETGPMVNLADARGAPEDIVLQQDEVERVRGAILALKEPYAQVSVQYFLEEKSIDEIAKKLGRPPKTVHTQLCRAKQMLQAKLKERGEHDGIVPH